MNDAVIEYLKKEEYTHLRYINGVLCGIRRFLFTTGLMVGLNRIGYDGRYCYESHADAVAALEKWDMNGDPDGDWIKYKGKGGERSRYMKTENELKGRTTDLEFAMLSEIVKCYSFDNNICYMQPLSDSEKGIIGSLVKKGLIYDSFISEKGEGSNFFPSDEVLDIYGLKHY